MYNITGKNYDYDNYMTVILNNNIMIQVSYDFIEGVLSPHKYVVL